MNPEQEAVNQWFASEEGKSCCNVDSLDTRTDTYLRNRLWKAFIAGQDSGRHIERQTIMNKNAVNVDALPQANNTRVNYLGRNIYSIEGHPGLYMQKKPTPMGPKPDPIVARKCVGKGGNSGIFYRVPELEATLREALKEEEAK